MRSNLDSTVRIVIFNDSKTFLEASFTIIPVRCSWITFSIASAGLVSPMDPKFVSFYTLLEREKSQSWKPSSQPSHSGNSVAVTSGNRLAIGVVLNSMNSDINPDRTSGLGSMFRIWLN